MMITETYLFADDFFAVIYEILWRWIAHFNGPNLSIQSRFFRGKNSLLITGEVLDRIGECGNNLCIDACMCMCVYACECEVS